MPPEPRPRARLLLTGARAARGHGSVRPVVLLLLLAACDGDGCANDEPDWSGVPEAPLSFGEGYVRVPASDGEPFVGPIGEGDFAHGQPMEFSTAVFADLDRDGRLDVIMSLFDNVRGMAPRAYRFDADAHTLVFAPDLVVPVASPFGAVDLDDDGYVDVVSTDLLEGVAWGLPDGGLTRPTPTIFPFEDSQPARAMSGAFADVDRDGLLDLMAGFSKCEPRFSIGPGVKLFLNRGDRTFEDRTDLINLSDNASGAAMFLTPLGRNERVIVTSPSADCATGRLIQGTNRQARVDADGYPRFEEYVVTEPGKGFRSELPFGDRMSPFIYFGSMGFASGDLDGDGLIDLGTTLNPYHGFLQSQGRDDGLMVDRTLDVGFGLVPAPGTGKAQIGWGMAFVDIDRDGRPDVVTTHGDDYIAGDEYYIGPQQVTAHWNAGGFRFRDVTGPLKLSRLGHYMSLAVDDFDEDGDVDLAAGGQAGPPDIYRNEVGTPHAGFSLELRGTTSNVWGLEAEVLVTVEEGKPVQRHHVGGVGSPLAVSRQLVFVGLGEAEVAALVRVTWPSGTVQEFRNLAAGKLHVVREPPSIELEPQRRHLPADGSSAFRVRVLPREVNGTLRPDASVSVRLSAGPGTVRGPVEDAGEGTVFEVVAPSRPGSSVVEVSIDGAPLGVRPRLWWDAP